MPQGQRLQRYFSPILMIFIGIVLVLVAGVLYLAFSKTTIQITAAEVPSTVPFQYTPTDLGVTATSLDIKDAYTYTDYKASSTEDAVARGTVTLINESSGNQGLVATTRLLSTEGVLFRTDETVTVPAGGSVDVTVYADQAGASGNIPASRFEIVALNASLKTQIYATSATAMTGGVIKKVTLTDTLIEQAKTAALDALTAALTKTYQPENLVITVTDQTVNGASGDTVEAVVVETVGSAVYVPITSELVSGDYTIQTDGEEILISGETVQTAEPLTKDFIDPANLTGKTEQQVRDYLADFEQVEEVEVHFVPFWLDRTPQLPQQIKIEIVP
ncbi:MAG: hypothetical protein ACD_41C00306G0004 [uncultured bacterium]|nr:MAG: hypothetical protein ACD_41C00306G0004 [uncultured bacterium]HBY73494.1 hypothetical protein [Candidatus Kerfeldbacteria bacterium]